VIASSFSATDVAAAPRSPTDQYLVLRAKAGDTRAYGELVDRYQDRVYTLVHGMVNNVDDALDLTQNVFLKGYSRLGQFREDAVFYTWIYRIAVNTCIDAARRRRRNPEPYSLDDPQYADNSCEPSSSSVYDDPYRSLINDELGARVRAALSGLSPILRGAFILHDLEGLSQQEVAEVLGCPLGTAKSRIQRARLELRERLRGFVEEPSS
jgi:RNA polymerase sigma-70 factor, ECF subfamily